MPNRLLTVKEFDVACREVWDQLTDKLESPMPSAADLDAVAEEERIRQLTGGSNGRPQE